MSHSHDFPALSDILPRVAKGDHAAFTLLVRQYTAKLLGYATRIANDTTTADDVVQEVWYWVWMHHSTIGEMQELVANGAFERYLRRAAYHRLIDRRRAERARDARDGRFVETGMRTPQALLAEEQLETTELSQALSAAVNALPERRREIILRRWSMQSTKEIAAALGISTKTVEAQITAAYASLRDVLQRFVEK